MSSLRKKQSIYLKKKIENHKMERNHKFDRKQLDDLQRQMEEKLDKFRMELLNVKIHKFKRKTPWTMKTTKFTRVQREALSVLINDPTSPTGIVVMNTRTYIEKIKGMLNDETFYKSPIKKIDEILNKIKWGID